MTDEQDAKKKWLSRASDAEKEANAWIAKYQHDKSFAERTSRSQSGIGSGSFGNGTEDAYLQLAETERIKNEMTARSVRIRKEIQNAIATVDNSRMRTILTRHYLAYETFETVAEALGCDERTVRRKHIAALDKIIINVLECPVDIC